MNNTKIPDTSTVCCDEKKFMTRKRYPRYNHNFFLKGKEPSIPKELKIKIGKGNWETVGWFIFAINFTKGYKLTLKVILNVTNIIYYAVNLLVMLTAKLN